MHIIEPVGITQEIMHTIKMKKLQAMVLKLDLVKAFDRVNWNFLRLVLLQIGVPVDVVNWIMGCVSSSNFSILVNGTPRKIFLTSRGIRQGCPLYNLLFIVVIEGLNIIINDAQRKGKIKGIKVSSSMSITLLLFVDDVILFGLGILEE